MDANNALPANDIGVPTSEDTVMTTETTTQSVTVEETNKNQDSLDQALADPIQKEDYDSSDLDLSSDEDSSSADERDANDDEDNDDEDRPSNSMPASAHELTDITIDRPQFEMTDETTVEYIGTIFSVIDKTVVVQSQTQGHVLDMESLLVFEQNRAILGEVFETFGPVDRPFYSVRFNSIDEIPALALKNARICYVPSYERTQLVQVEKLKLIKGTDASNRYDEEAGDDELEFSDDEQELAYNRSKKKKNKKQQKKKTTITNDNNVEQSQSYNNNNRSSTMANDHRQLQSYADIMGTSIINPVQSRQPDTMGDLLNSYMTSRPLPPSQPHQFQHTSSTTAKQEPHAPKPVPTLTSTTTATTTPKSVTTLATSTTTSTESSTIVKQEPSVSIVNQDPTASLTVNEEPITTTATATVTPEQPSTSFFQSIRSLFSRGPPSS